MSITSVETLLAVLRRAEIVTPEQAEQVARELAPHYPDPWQLGEYLVQIDWLTPYQLQLLFCGQWDGLTVGPYQVLDRLGEGGLSEVFKAWDTVHGRLVALKVLRQHLQSAEAERQFQRELQAVTRLSHPNVIRTHEAQRVGPLHYFAMEFVEGMDLFRFVSKVGPLPVEVACDCARQVAQGLQHAHQVGLVHRDIKPANLFLINPPLPGPGGQPLPRAQGTVVKVLDWGLARCLREDGQAAGRLALDDEKGRLIGTADYIAPEQARDPTLVDTRADVYSLGCTLFFLLTAQPPYPGPSLMQKLIQHQEAPPPSPRAVRSDVPEELVQIVQRMMAKEPAERFQIPLLVVAPLRRFCPGGLLHVGHGGVYRPGSSGALLSPSSANLPRPGSSVELARPNTSLNLPRPGTALNLPRPGANGDGRPAP